jgi:tetratricopeptide (TPR) repeat protein
MNKKKYLPLLLSAFFFRPQMGDIHIPKKKASSQEVSLAIVRATDFYKEKKLDLALKEFSFACLNDFKSACFAAATLASQLGRDTDEAKYLKLSCKYDFSYACHNYGLILFEQANLQESRTFFEKGCRLNFADSCNNLGNIQEEDKEVDLAFKNYKRSCFLDSDKGCFNLSRLYFFKGDKQNGEYYLKKSCQTNPSNCPEEVKDKN